MLFLLLLLLLLLLMLLLLLLFLLRCFALLLLLFRLFDGGRRELPKSGAPASLPWARGRPTPRRAPKFSA